MTIRKFHIYLVNLDPQFGTEPGKIRPAVVVQTNLLNSSKYDHLSHYVAGDSRERRASGSFKPERKWPGQRLRYFGGSNSRH